MSKITLEDVARYIDDIVEAHQLNGVQTFTLQMEPAMALVRAAAKVVEACRALVDDAARPERGRSLRVCAVHFEAGSEALAAFDKAGEKP